MKKKPQPVNHMSGKYAAAKDNRTGAKPEVAQNPDKYTWLPFATLGVITAVTLFARLRLLDLPLERDEGEYAYVAQQMLQGVPPFVSIYHLKLPGIYAVYAVIEWLFGQSCSGIHSGLLLANLASATIIFLVLRKLFDRSIACYSVACFLLLSLSKVLTGFSANAEQFVLPFAFGGIFCLLKGFDFKDRGDPGKASLFFFVSGLLLSFSYLVKQHG